MNEPYLEYSEDIDKKIIKAIKDDLHVHVLSSDRLTGGEFNYSYKITTENGVWIARVFRERNSPTDSKLEWIEKQLSAHQISHAKMIYYSRNQKHFPYGYMVQEFIQGYNGFDAIMQNNISFEEFFNREARLLQKIHSIQTQKFGEIHANGIAEYDTYYELKHATYEKIHSKLNQMDDLYSKVHDKVLTYVQRLEKYSPNLNACLLHGDPPPGNAIITKTDEIVLIDWDNAISSSWIDEYAGLVIGGAFMWQSPIAEEERIQLIQKAFSNNYKGVDFDDPTLIEIIDILRVLKSYGGLAVHFFQHEDMELYQKAKLRLLTLLNMC